jgi:hypothetical protein
MTLSMYHDKIGHYSDFRRWLGVGTPHGEGITVPVRSRPKGSNVQAHACLCFLLFVPYQLSVCCEGHLSSTGYIDESS